MSDSMTQLLKHATDMQVYPNRNDWSMNTDNPQPMRDLWQAVEAAAVRAEIFNGDERILLLLAKNDDKHYHIKRKGFVATAYRTTLCSGNWSMCFPLTSLDDDAWIVRLDCFNFANRMDLVPVQLPALTLRDFFTRPHTHYIFNIETKSLEYEPEDSISSVNIIEHVSRNMKDNEHKDIIPRVLTAEEKGAASKSAAQEEYVNHGSLAPQSVDNPGRIDDRDARMAFLPLERSPSYVFGSGSHLETGQKSFERAPLEPSTGQALPQSNAFHLGTDSDRPSAKRRIRGPACLTCRRRRARCSGEHPTCAGYRHTNPLQESLDCAEKRRKVTQPGASPAIETEQPEQPEQPEQLSHPLNPPPFRNAQNHGVAPAPIAASSNSSIAAEFGSHNGGQASQIAITKTGCSTHNGERNWGLEVEHAHRRLGMLESVVEGLMTENANLKIRLEILERMLE